jgi:hypothetical protein
VGESPGLCAANSSFVQSYEACDSCIQANGGNNSTNNTLLPELQPFISFCSAVTADPAGPAPTYLSAAKSSLLAQASSLGLTLGTTVQITQTSVVDHTVTVAQPSTCQLSLTHPTPQISTANHRTVRSINLLKLVTNKYTLQNYDSTLDSWGRSRHTSCCSSWGTSVLASDAQEAPQGRDRERAATR